MGKLWRAPKNEGYMIFVRDGFNAIVPQTDTKPHNIDSMTCHCDPTSDVDAEDNLYIVHQSFRERAALDGALNAIF